MKNVFENTVEMLIKDADSLQKKFIKLQELNDFRGAVDCMRLLKDCLSLIKEYDWKLQYSEYKTGDSSEIAIWEQNHCGEIKNHKTWDIKMDRDFCHGELWYEMFKGYLIAHKSHLVNFGSEHRGIGKSYAIAKLCNDYNGVIVTNGTRATARNLATGVITNCKLYNFNVNIISYEDAFLSIYEDSIFFIDEHSKLSSEQLERLFKYHTIIGFDS